MGKTIIDIAKAAGTSKSTVSRYLNGGSVKPATARSIEEAVKALRFRPNVNARRLVTNRTNIIGVVLDDITNTYYSDILSGIQRVAGEQDYVCTFYSRINNRREETDYLELFQEGQVDGLIMGTFQIRIPRQVKKLANSGYPIVLVGDSAGERGIDSVDVDNKGGTADQVRYLHGLGHRRIAYLRGPEHLNGANYREAGFRRGMEELGLDPGRVLATEWTVQGGYEAGRRLMESMDFTAVMCSNEHCTFGLIRALQEQGLRVPQDISVAAFDDGFLAMYADPPITTIAQPFYDLGAKAAGRMVELLEDGGSAKTSVLLQPELVIRGSCAKVCNGSEERSYSFT